MMRIVVIVTAILAGALIIAAAIFVVGTGVVFHYYLTSDLSAEQFDQLLAKGCALELQNRTIRCPFWVALR
jgi:hypothetical protein